MTRRVHIVASCADRKVLPVPSDLRLGSHRAHGSVSRFDSFVRALRTASGETRPARDLYAGPYWAVVRQLPEVAAVSGFEAQLWVASAGYGLVPAAADLHGYSATFRSGERDSVSSGGADASIASQLAAWWTALSEWAGPSTGSPRSLRALADRDGAPVLVLASPRYVEAMANDLRAAAAVLGDALLVITSHEPANDDPLAANVVPSQESLIGHVDGSRPALHARVARHILANVQRHPLSARALRTRYEKLARNSRYTRTPDRAPMTDDEVRRFIRRQLSGDRKATHTRLLRVLRDGGRACEQKRFRNLFREEASDAR